MDRKKKDSFIKEEEQITELGDKFYTMNSDNLIYKKLSSFNEGILQLDNITVERKYIPGKGDHVVLSYTQIDTVDPKATIAICHGIGQNTDLFIELGILFALNGYKVIMIDFSGFGWSGGARLNQTIIDQQNDVVTMLKEADPELPLFVY